MLVVYYNQADSNIVTSTHLDIFCDLTGRPASQVWNTTTDAGTDSTDYFGYKYTAINTKIAVYDLFRFRFTGDQMAANSDIAMHSIVLWLH
jgi:hypothetical protein